MADLERLVEQHPFREGLWALLVTAQGEAGRPADGLATYRRARERLVADEGIEQGEELRAAQRAVLDRQEMLTEDGDQATTSPVPSPVGDSQPSGRA